MRTVYKYPLLIQDYQVIRCQFQRILHVGLDASGIPSIWIEVITDKVLEYEYVDIPIYIVGTGHPIPEGAVYIGTFMEKPFIWHVYWGA